jgi:hypothetical protein
MILAIFREFLKNYAGCSPTEYRRRADWVIAPEYLISIPLI